MEAYAVPALVAVLTWWLGTGVVLRLNRLPRRTRVWSFVGASVLAGAALLVMVATSARATPVAAYGSFLAGVMLWGWHELTFLQGLITGPSKAACPPDAGPVARFLLAARALLYHELAIAATLVLVVMATWGSANQIGALTFLILFGMRLSAKLNVFLGVPHLAEEFLPEQLEFLKSYFGRRPMNGLFPISITVATLLAAYVFHSAFEGANGFETTGWMLLGSLIVLGTLEHWLLVLPLPDAALWRWALRETGSVDSGKDGVLRKVGAPGKPGAVGTVSLRAIPGEGRIP